MKIALATCSSLPHWEVDDEALHDALRDRHLDFDRPPWDDPHYDWSQPTACLIRTTWDYTDRVAEFVTWADRVSRFTRLFNPAPIVRWNTDKRYLQDLAQRGVDILPTIWLPRGEPAALDTLLNPLDWTRAFLKPAIGATSRHTLRFENTPAGRKTAQAHADRLLPHQTLLLQPYYDSVETTGELSAIFIADEYAHGVRKVPQPGDYRVQDDFGAHDEPYTFNAAERELARQVLDAVRQPLLYARTDFLRDPAGRLHLIELEIVEPSLFFRHHRPTADLLADALLAALG